MRVLFSVHVQRDRSNPYVRLLVRSLESFVDVSYFTWPRALFGRYDLFHIQWPETLLTTSRVWLRPLKLLLVAILVVRLGRKKLVITLHNQSPHEPVGRLQSRLLTSLYKRTDGWIVLNSLSERPTEKPSVLIPHGEYRTWYGAPKEPASARSGFLFFGLIRPYKGIDRLINAYASVQGATVEPLKIEGNTSDQEFARVLHSLADPIAGVELTLKHIADDQLIRDITSATMVILPYREMHNSGAALLALSFDTPILVPRNDVTEQLRSEFGDEWVYLYDEPLRGTDLVSISRVVRSSATTRGSVDMSGREWPRIGELHSAFYTRIVND